MNGSEDGRPTLKEKNNLNKRPTLNKKPLNRGTTNKNLTKCGKKGSKHYEKSFKDLH